MGWNSDESLDEIHPGMLALSGRQPFTLTYCREHPGAPRDACACAQADTRVQNACTQTGADSQCGIKVTESWQISAADESLTWGCWIDNPSVGTLLAFSSFWEEQNESRVVQMLLHPGLTWKLELIVQRHGKSNWWQWMRSSLKLAGTDCIQMVKQRIISLVHNSNSLLLYISVFTKMPLCQLFKLYSHR